MKEKGVPVILVQAPVSKAQIASVLNRGEIDRYFSSLGLPYYNFNEILSLDDTCFVDPHHLNQRGVTIFNNALISKLKSLSQPQFSSVN